MLFTGLTASTPYYYRVGGTVAGSAVWSNEFSFDAAPALAATQETKLAVYGDMGTVMPLVGLVSTARP